MKMGRILFLSAKLMKIACAGHHRMPLREKSFRLTFTLPAWRVAGGRYLWKKTKSTKKNYWEQESIHSLGYGHLNVSPNIQRLGVYWSSRQMSSNQRSLNLHQK